MIFGTVFDDAMEDQLRVTVVATGLGGKVARRSSRAVPSLVQHTGTDNYGIEPATDYGVLDKPAVFRTRAHAADRRSCSKAGWTSTTSRPFCASRRTEARSAAGAVASWVGSNSWT